MGYADLHIHSIYSHDGTSTIPAILKYVADRTNLKVIAITDHDKVGGIREAVALGPKYGIEVIPGCEVTTAQGHLLALFITHAIPAGLSLHETIRIVGKMGGLCVAPHPEARAIQGLRSSVIRQTVADPELASVLVGIETFNSGLFNPSTNHVALALGRSLDMACIGASDSHILDTLGQGLTEFEGSSAADLRAAILARATIPHAVGQSMPVHKVLSRWFVQYSLRRMGWVAWNAEPEEPLRYVRAKLTHAVNSSE